MPVRTSLAFRALDTHVVAGRADDPALLHDGGALSFAELLDASASLAGGLLVVGAREGEGIEIATEDPHVRVVSVLAAIRLGLTPGTGVWIGDDPARVRHAGQDEAWDLLLRAGRGDPLSATPDDPAGFSATWLAAHPAVLEPLLEGRPAVL